MATIVIAIANNRTYVCKLELFLKLKPSLESQASNIIDVIIILVISTIITTYIVAIIHFAQLYGIAQANVELFNFATNGKR